jgi:hypothetical protein
MPKAVQELRYGLGDLHDFSSWGSSTTHTHNTPTLRRITLSPTPDIGAQTIRAAAGLLLPLPPYLQVDLLKSIAGRWIASVTAFTLSVKRIKYDFS